MKNSISLSKRLFTKVEPGINCAQTSQEAKGSIKRVISKIGVVRGRERVCGIISNVLNRILGSELSMERRERAVGRRPANISWRVDTGCQQSGRACKKVMGRRWTWPQWPRCSHPHIENKVGQWPVHNVHICDLASFYKQKCGDRVDEYEPQEGEGQSLDKSRSKAARRPK